MNRLAKILTGAAASVGLLALVFTGKGDSQETADRSEVRRPSSSGDPAATVRAPREPEGSGILHEDLDGTDLFVG